MHQMIRASALCVVVFLLLACKEEPAPMVAHIFYTACVGSQEGSCSDQCCANQLNRNLGEEARLDCEIREGDLDSTYRLEFRVSSPDAEGGPIVDAENLQFNQGASNPQSLRSPNCHFAITEDGREYVAGSCDNLDVGAEPGGGCQVQVHVDVNNNVVGRFQCKELGIETGPLSMSTVHNGNIGWGEFTIENCDFRL